jgi:hypothetical protein
MESNAIMTYYREVLELIFMSWNEFKCSHGLKTIIVVNNIRNDLYIRVGNTNISYKQLYFIMQLEVISIRNKIKYGVVYIVCYNNLIRRIGMFQFQFVLLINSYFLS